MAAELDELLDPGLVYVPLPIPRDWLAKLAARAHQDNAKPEGEEPKPPAGTASITD